MMTRRTMRAVALAVAPLLLATGTAHARSWAAYHCGKYEIAELPPKYFYPNPDADGHLHCNPCDGKAHYYWYYRGGQGERLIDRWIREKGDDLFFRGKLCRQFDEEEYDDEVGLLSCGDRLIEVHEHGRDRYFMQVIPESRSLPKRWFLFWRRGGVYFRGVKCLAEWR